MDKKGQIKQHSKIKLELYRSYLSCYLSVIANSGFYKEIIIHDIFAGSGISINKEKGSAILAAEEIQKIKDQYPNVKFTLRVNDKDQKNYLSLVENTKDYEFCNNSNIDANNYIENWERPDSSHNLFFVDPFGYTSLEKRNLIRLLSFNQTDILIFVPISHIYRFLKKQDDDKRLEPIEKFLNDLEVDEDSIANIDCVEEFADSVKNSISGVTDSEFVYREILESQNRANKYCLYFITRNILGAEKFLESQDKLKSFSNDLFSQKAFLFPEEGVPSILDFVSSESTYDNKALYKIAIKNGILSKYLGKELKKLENDGTIEVNECVNQQRNKKAFYVNYSNYKRNVAKKLNIGFK